MGQVQATKGIIANACLQINMHWLHLFYNIVFIGYFFIYEEIKESCFKELY